MGLDHSDAPQWMRLASFADLPYRLRCRGATNVNEPESASAAMN